MTGSQDFSPPRIGWGVCLQAFPSFPFLGREKNSGNDVESTSYPSKWQRQLFLLTCFMSSYDRFIGKNVFTSYVDLCVIHPFTHASYDPPFFSTEIWATCELRVESVVF